MKRSTVLPDERRGFFVAGRCVTSSYPANPHLVGQTCQLTTFFNILGPRLNIARYFQQFSSTFLLAGLCWFYATTKNRFSVHLACYMWSQWMAANVHMGEFVVEGFFFLEVVTFFVTLRADLEDYFKCKT